MSVLSMNPIIIIIVSSGKDTEWGRLFVDLIESDLRSTACVKTFLKAIKRFNPP